MRCASSRDEAMADDAGGDAPRVGRGLGRLGRPDRRPAADCPTLRRERRNVSADGRQLANRVTVLEANLDFVYRSLAYKQGDPMPSITSAQKNVQGLYSTGPGPSDAALAARVSAWRERQEKALQGQPAP